MIQLNVDQGALTQTYLATAPDLTLEDAKAFYVPLGQAFHTMHPQVSLPQRVLREADLRRLKTKNRSMRLGNTVRRRSLDTHRRDL